MQRSTISVITPTHPARLRNGLFAECAQSVHAQTLLPDAHCVAIDVDGDGAAVTRNRALQMARTDWVAMLDSDDLFLPKHLQRVLTFAQDNDLDFVYSWFKVLQDFGGGNRRVLEEDPVFPVSHYLNPWNPDDPIETTVTTFVRTELAQSVGYHALDRGEENGGEDFAFTIGCMKAGAKIGHLVRKTWLWRHHSIDGVAMNTSGMATKGDAA